jgi:nucleoside-diphosphate-sugar epimerase
MRGPMTGADAVFHVAGWYKVGVRDPVGPRVNVEGTRNVLELMSELGTPKGVYTSTLAVNSDTRGRVVDENYQFDGTHLSVYDASKAEAHRIAADFGARGLPLVVVQPGAVYGPGDTSALGTMWRRFLQRRLPPLPSKTAVCWGFIDDIVRGHILALEKGQAGRSYFLAGPAHTFIEAVQLASEITHIPAPRLRLPPFVLKVAAWKMGLLDRMVDLPPEYTGEGLRVLAGVTYLGSSTLARKELGWRARPLRDGLMETLRHEVQAAGMTPSW